MAKGKVYLVGAGPGDPGLITVKGLDCLAKAQAVVYDRLVDDRLLACIPPGAEMIYVGKQSSRHTLKQHEINALLVEKAKEGKIVVRLKGGDPFVFGRGGEEAETLAGEGIPFEIVPGISASVAVPAYAGIPVTHRGYASSFAVITGHEDANKNESTIAWDKLSTGVDTLVFLMGVEHLPQIVERLVKNGRPASTPVALVREGTRPGQRTLVGTLASIERLVSENNFLPPAVLVVGEVVGLRPQLRWFDNRPLFGKKVLVTRTRQQASVLSKLLADLGADPVELPTIEIEPMPDYAELDLALDKPADYDWIVFTSANGVEVFFERLRARSLDARALAACNVCAIGPATADALKVHGVVADYIPPEYVAESIVEGFAGKGVRGKRFLLPRADIARAELAEGLEKLGAKVKEIAVYRTLVPADGQSRGRQMLLDGEIDVVTFTSSSTVRNLVSLLGDDREALNTTKIACIGQITAATAAELGLKVDVVSAEHTIPGLVEAIVGMYD